MAGKTTAKNTKASSSKSTSAKKKPSSASRSRKTASRSSAYSAKRKSNAKTTSKARSSRSARGSRTNSSSKIEKAILYLLGAVLVTAFWYLAIRPEIARHRPCTGCESYNVCLPNGFTVHGIDISHHQGEINWNTLQSLQDSDTPLAFVFVKATEGGDHKDSEFQKNFKEAAAHGFIRGAYHFYNPETDPVRQADFFISNVELSKGDLPPVIDIEVKPSRAQQDTFYAQLATFLYRLEAHYGARPIVYTSYKYKERYLSAPEFDRYPLWIAHYHVDQLKYRGEWAFWQHSDRAVIPGIPEKTDLNVFNGSIKDLRKLALPE